MRALRSTWVQPLSANRGEVGEHRTANGRATRPRVISIRSRIRAFTLIEIMVVVAIIALIVGAGLPSLYGVFHKEGLRKTTSDIMDTCQSARAQAIISGSISELVFHPKDGTCEASGGANHGTWVHSAKLDGCTIEMLDVNLQECKDFDTVKVRFFPNGTCDELTLVLRSKDNEWRKITLEVTTALPTLTTSLR